MTTELAQRPDRNRRRSRLSERSALLNPLPVIGTAVATFLAIFALLVGRVVTGADPAAHWATVAAVSSTRNGSGTPLRTTASGAVIPAAASAGAGTSSAGTAVPIATRTSGGGGVATDD
ncbi:MAG TPA: hypothetical protein VNR42_04615 [Solirubrobacteraceae bacterium]|nr:hypothetical protein [Solirubrobacteraceae bacterium]